MGFSILNQPFGASSIVFPIIFPSFFPHEMRPYLGESLLEVDVALMPVVDAAPNVETMGMSMAGLPGEVKWGEIWKWMKWEIIGILRSSILRVSHGNKYVFFFLSLSLLLLFFTRSMHAYAYIYVHIHTYIYIYIHIYIWLYIFMFSISSHRWR